MWWMCSPVISHKWTTNMWWWGERSSLASCEVWNVLYGRWDNRSFYLLFLSPSFHCWKPSEAHRLTDRQLLCQQAAIFHTHALYESSVFTPAIPWGIKVIVMEQQKLTKARHISNWKNTGLAKVELKQTMTEKKQAAELQQGDYEE